MKKLFLLIISLIAFNSSYCQSPPFTFKADGSTDYVIYSLAKMKAPQLYNKTLAWINEFYENPDSVIKAKTENEMIRINGFMKDAFIRQLSTSTTGYDCSYTLVIEFQDGKYRIKFDVNEITVDNNKVFFSLIDVINNIKDKNGNHFNGSVDSFEVSVNNLMDLHHKNVQNQNKW